MEIWFVAIFLALAVLLGWGTVRTVRRRQLTGRQRRWRELETRFNQVASETTRYETDPQRALDAPGWLDGRNPLVRGFTGTLKRAQRVRDDLERAAQLDPSDEDLQRFELVVEQLEDAYQETDRAVRLTGWTQPGSLQIPHAQFMLDPRWGGPARLPQLNTTSTQADHVGAAVKEFLDQAYPIHRDAVVKILRTRSGSVGARRTQKALDHLVETGRFVVDAEGMLWPGSVRTEVWGVHRVFGRGADLNLEQVPLVEISNAAWVVLGEDRHLNEAELVTELREFLELNHRLSTGLSQGLASGLNRGLSVLPEGVQKALNDVIPPGVLTGAEHRMDHRLTEGIRTGLISGRLQRQADGKICRLRTDWPTTYR